MEVGLQGHHFLFLDSRNGRIPHADQLLFLVEPCMQVCERVCVCVCVYVSLCLCVLCLCMWLCLCVLCLCVCVHVRSCVCVCVHVLALEPKAFIYLVLPLLVLQSAGSPVLQPFGRQQCQVPACLHSL